MLWFTVGFLIGLPIGIFLYFPESMFIAMIAIEVLRLPGKNMPLLPISLALYGVWLLVILATFRFVARLTWEAPVPPGHPPLAPRRTVRFFLGFLCSIPLATIYINYGFQSSGLDYGSVQTQIIACLEDVASWHFSAAQTFSLYVGC